MWSYQNNSLRASNGIYRTVFVLKCCILRGRSLDKFLHKLMKNILKYIFIIVFLTLELVGIFWLSAIGYPTEPSQNFCWNTCIQGRRKFRIILVSPRSIGECWCWGWATPLRSAPGRRELSLVLLNLGSVAMFFRLIRCLGFWSFLMGNKNVFEFRPILNPCNSTNF